MRTNWTASIARSPSTTRGRKRRGASAVELGIVLPILLLIVYGAVDFGRFASTYIAVSNSARAAAGFGSMHPPSAATLALWQERLRQQAIAEMQGNIDAESNFNEDDVTVTSRIVVENMVMGFQRVDVTVSFPFETIIDLPGLPGTFEISRNVSIRAIR